MTRFSDHLPLYRSYFNSHPHEEDDDASCQSLGDIESFQLTSSRRGWRSIMLFIWYTSIFQLTSSRRGWPAQQTLDQLLRQFQLTSSRRGWHDGRCVKSCCSYFNSHPHEEDDVFSSPQVSFYKHFNSHPHEEDDGSLAKSIFGAHYFNSHPHEEDDSSIRLYVVMDNISTHILTKRMTLISNHPHRFLEYFNSHPHEEDDLKLRHKVTSLVKISTHILTKRMTTIWSALFPTSAFQLTSSRRGWLCHPVQCYFQSHFNSHPHEEDDEASLITRSSPAIFQLTSSRRGWHLWIVLHLLQ